MTIARLIRRKPEQDTETSRDRFDMRLEALSKTRACPVTLRQPIFGRYRKRESLWAA